ncbi:MAG: MmgE/PrpD family protein [Acidimicrobiia bacterium]|nr:MmgE/PrpD family protein [Acidimicrobiia bacterium]
MNRRTLLTRGSLALGTLLLPARLRAEVGPVMARLSAYMAAAKDRALPAAALAETIHHTLDTLAAMVSGAELVPGRAVLKFARENPGPAVATIAASNLKTSAMDAALLNGILAHSDETDDSHGESQSHPGAAVVPAALAMAEALGISGRHFLRAVALGYDVGPRLTMALGAVTFRNETRRSTHSIAGTFGAAAAAGCVASLNDTQMRWLLDYASQSASGYAVWERDTDHIEKGFVFAGGPARNGVTAAMFVRSGFTGVDDVFSGPDNYFQVNAPTGSPEKLVEALGERYEVVRTDIKKWSVGTPIQAPLDAIANLRARRPFTAEQVTNVVVRLAPTVGAVVNNRDIPDISLQYMVAVMLLDGTASFAAAHDTARMNDAAVRRERAKIQYVPDPDLARLLPVRVAVVEVTLTDGTTLSDRVEAVRGTVRNPMTREEIVDKARDLMAPVLGAPQARQLIDAVLALDAAPDVRRVAGLLHNPRGGRA